MNVLERGSSVRCALSLGAELVLPTLKPRITVKYKNYRHYSKDYNPGARYLGSHPTPQASPTAQLNPTYGLVSFHPWWCPSVHGSNLRPGEFPPLVVSFRAWFQLTAW